MELLQLRYFQVTAQFEHMTKAAEVLRVSQPALSKTISRLEENLGTSLFNREGRQIYLNDFGKIFLQRVNRIIQEIEEGERQIKEMAGLKARSTSVSIALPHILPFFIVEFMKRDPKMHIRQYSASSIGMKKQLENAEVDFCISMDPIYGDEIEWMPLLDEEVFLSVPQDHHLAKRESITLYEAANETFISRTSGYGFRDLTDDFCRQAGFEPYTPIELEEAGAILRLVEMGIGVSFTPQLSLLRQSLPSTVQLPITNPVCRRTIGIAWNRNHYLSPTALDFRKFTIDFFKHIAITYYQK
ncbi:LysR family transcriptional regulator [Peribacillus frigoritolerans]|uniref:LysR family transcriptional regulator n=1 Tax=Peribacillus frigoritolerans TaxID=450367 RepID=UPI002282F39B|nr:LysR family transcriptional regulator [Peribacillus frigoritolerans]MCY8935478.1 LysR family transcriptional regulator [Peribacillus frigoritolerans]